jgi:hypothetical protein
MKVIYQLTLLLSSFAPIVLSFATLLSHTSCLVAPMHATASQMLWSRRDILYFVSTLPPANEFMIDSKTYDGSRVSKSSQGFSVGVNVNSGTVSQEPISSFHRLNEGKSCASDSS